MGSKSSIFLPWKLISDPEEQEGTSHGLLQALWIILWPPVNSSYSYGSETPKSGQFFCPLWPWNLTDDLPKTIRYLFYATSSFMHCFVTIGNFKLELQSGNSPIGSKVSALLPSLTFQFDWWPLKNNRAPLRCCFKLFVSFRSHWSLQTGVTVRKRKLGQKLVLTSVTLTFEIWPWPIAWTSLLSIAITLDNFMVRWQEHCEQGIRGCTSPCLRPNQREWK